eukprot:363578-Chlamydomonas_euryale.AAC.1
MMPVACCANVWPCTILVLQLQTGCAALAAYGFIPTLQPEGASFARVYAVYGGVFIIMSYAWAG